MYDEKIERIVKAIEDFEGALEQVDWRGDWKELFGKEFGKAVIQAEILGVPANVTNIVNSNGTEPQDVPCDPEKKFFLRSKASNKNSLLFSILLYGHGNGN